MADANPPDVFNSVQSAAMGEIGDAVGADSQYATAFRPPASVVSGVHVAGSPVGFSDAALESFQFFDAAKQSAQDAINGGANGVVTSGYTNYSNDTGD